MAEASSPLHGLFSYLALFVRRCNWCRNELPWSGFEPASSSRVFNLCVCSPLDNILTSLIYNRIEQVAPNIHVVFKSSLNQNTEHQLRYQETEFVISYEEFRRPEFTSIPLFNDEMVLVASKNTRALAVHYSRVMSIMNNMPWFRSIASHLSASRGMTHQINNPAWLIREWH